MMDLEHIDHRTCRDGLRACGFGSLAFIGSSAVHTCLPGAVPLIRASATTPSVPDYYLARHVLCWASFEHDTYSPALFPNMVNSHRRWQWIIEDFCRWPTFSGDALFNRLLSEDKGWRREDQSLSEALKLDRHTSLLSRISQAVLTRFRRFQNPAPLDHFIEAVVRISAQDKILLPVDDAEDDEEYYRDMAPLLTIAEELLANIDKQENLKDKKFL